MIYDDIRDGILRCYLGNYPIYLTYFSLEQIYLDKIDLINVTKYDLNISKNWCSHQSANTAYVAKRKMQ